MSYRKRGAWERLPDTTAISAIDLAERPGNRRFRRAGIHGGKGFGPLKHAALVAASGRRRDRDPAPWETGTRRARIGAES